MRHFINRLCKASGLLVILVSILINPTISIAQAATQWWPNKGTIMLAGGHLSPSSVEDFGKRLIALAGGPDALIVIIPTADPNIQPQINKSHAASDPDELKKWLESLGAHHVQTLHTRDRKKANSDAFAKVLRSAHAVFMPGGQALLLENTYRGTLVNAEMKALLARGGVIAGDSAGAIAIGSAWLTWLPDPFGKRADELNILPHVAVSPHANLTKGFVMDTEVIKYLAAHPGTVGIDIDENTIFIVDKGHAEVAGTGNVSVIDGAQNKFKPVLILKPGEKHHLN